MQMDYVMRVLQRNKPVGFYIDGNFNLASISTWILQLKLKGCTAKPNP